MAWRRRRCSASNRRQLPSRTRRPKPRFTSGWRRSRRRPRCPARRQPERSRSGCPGVIRCRRRPSSQRRRR
ncbi:hypothetical protein BG53_11020 [Paenibacillus darwinianus]|uniref:Uncharacterized protein n=1 Tax=Paenibacillus darwinianus TaxID=1380763 RepID=A0A9W5RZC3_9BACL|nr:hypothetical protein BG53_11020 [Paenibacillus darwinianus]EXX84584.1 hypothetical protein BG52_10425 [Paenibacillus darwinianus]